MKIERIQSLFTFRFQNRDGAVYPGEMVRWGGACFQVEAAKPSLRAAIEKARPKVPGHE